MFCLVQERRHFERHFFILYNRLFWLRFQHYQAVVPLLDFDSSAAPDLAGLPRPLPQRYAQTRNGEEYLSRRIARD